MCHSDLYYILCECVFQKLQSRAYLRAYIYKGPRRKDKYVSSSLLPLTLSFPTKGRGMIFHLIIPYILAYSIKSSFWYTALPWTLMLEVPVDLRILQFHKVLGEIVTHENGHRHPKDEWKHCICEFILNIRCATIGNDWKTSTTNWVWCFKPNEINYSHFASHNLRGVLS